MTVIVPVLVAILTLAGLTALFLRADARQVAQALRLAGPALLGVAGGVMLLIGRAAMGGMLLSGAAAWYAAQSKRKPQSAPTPGQRSSVRTAALEMELDHDTGGLEGLVLAGTYEGKMLGTLTQPQLLKLYGELSGDSESRQLLETYLDGRFPVWRDDAKANARNGHGVAPGAGAMSKEEAYKVLGLETGATAADVRQAHRRLMQRLHPDIGGTSFLAARINEAKDVLLSNHGLNS